MIGCCHPQRKRPPEEGLLCDSLPEGGNGSLQGASRRGGRAVALTGQQAVRLKGKHPVRVIWHLQVLPVAAHPSELVYRLASDLDGDAGLQNTAESLKYERCRMQIKMKTKRLYLQRKYE